MTIGYRLEKYANDVFGGVNGLAKRIKEITNKKTSIYKYVNDERAPGSTILEPLARLGLNINWLLTGEGEMLYKDVNKQDNNIMEIELVKLQGQIQLLKEMVVEYKIGK